MHWVFAAPFTKSEDDRWLIPFVPDKRHTFELTLARYHHDRSRKQADFSDWRDYFRHGKNAWTASQQSVCDAGVITVFPQLALTVGARKRIAKKQNPLLAWCFNVGQLYGGMKQKLAQFALRDVDRFIVHATYEIQNYSRWLNLPTYRFQFIPLQRVVQDIQFEEEIAQPFVLAMGSAHRDYRLFFKVMARLGYRTIIVAGRHAVNNLEVPHNITILNDLSINECHELVQKARINVIPIDNHETASGQVTLIDSMMYGRATVATRCVGTIDYAEDSRTAVLVEPGNSHAMEHAIQDLWEERACRTKLGRAARKYVETTLSDETAGRMLSDVLNELEDEHISRS